jgi:hypothetical protein
MPATTCTEAPVFGFPMLPRAARSLLVDFYALPKNERCQFAAVLEARADLWRSTPLDQAVPPVNVRAVPIPIDGAWRWTTRNPDVTRNRKRGWPKPTP